MFYLERTHAMMSTQSFECQKTEDIIKITTSVLQANLSDVCKPYSKINSQNEQEIKYQNMKKQLDESNPYFRDFPRFSVKCEEILKYFTWERSEEAHINSNGCLKHVFYIKEGRLRFPGLIYDFIRYAAQVVNENITSKISEKDELKLIGKIKWIEKFDKLAILNVEEEVLLSYSQPDNQSLIKKEKRYYVHVDFFFKICYE